jgi:hypothetical protein
MSLRDREYMQKLDGDDGERPPKPKIWVLALAIVLVLLFLLSLWPRH